MTHDPSRVAVVQLEAALRLYFEQEGTPEQGDQEGYYPVITLAGAAEEILARMLDKSLEGVPEEDRGKNSLDWLTSAAIEISQRLYGEAPSEEEVAAEANYARNRLKHWPPRGSMSFDAREEAKALLDRAVDNYFELTSDLTDAMRRFQEMHVGNNA